MEMLKVDVSGKRSHPKEAPCLAQGRVPCGLHLCIATLGGRGLVPKQDSLELCGAFPDRPDLSCPACRSRHQCLHLIILGVILDAMVSQARCQQLMIMRKCSISSCISVNGDEDASLAPSRNC